jgi:hypothetical protein
MQTQGHAFAAGVDPDRQAETAAEKGCWVSERGDERDNGEGAAAGRDQRAAACGETEYGLILAPAHFGAGVYLHRITVAVVRTSSPVQHGCCGRFDRGITSADSNHTPCASFCGKVVLKKWNPHNSCPGDLFA